jgi:hypothetical protein
MLLIYEKSFGNAKLIKAMLIFAVNLREKFFPGPEFTSALLTVQSQNFSLS